MSFLRDRSPVTPKMTSPHGPATRGSRRSRTSRSGFPVPSRPLDIASLAVTAPLSSRHHVSLGGALGAGRRRAGAGGLRPAVAGDLGAHLLQLLGHRLDELVPGDL